jgi:hypothetical protein
MSSRGLRATAVLPALLVLSLSGCGGGHAATPASRVPPGFYGIDGELLLPLAYRGLSGLLARHLAGIESSGVDFVRAGFNWSATEPRPPVVGRHHYYFGALDRWVGALASHRLRWQVVGLGPPIPAWAADRTALPVCGNRSPPARPADLAELMAALARRYGRGGSFWSAHPELPREPVLQYEVWNEENHAPSWCPRPDARSYADLYLAVHDAVHAVDPAALVMVGGLGAFRVSGPTPGGGPALEPGRFLAEMVAARPELLAKVDAVAIHIYDATPADVLRDLAWFRGRLAGAGLERTPMVLNETGWYTQGRGGLPATPDPRRAVYLRRLAETAPRTDCGLIGFAPHTWVTRERNPDDPEDWYGLANPATGAPYGSGVAYGEAVKLLQGQGPRPAPTETVPVCAASGQGAPP